jgi:hypothetical protein
MRVKIYVTLDLDPEEYPMPADENPVEELEDSLQDYFYEIEGVSIRNLKIRTE